jgi:hypothetical protein
MITHFKFQWIVSLVGVALGTGQLILSVLQSGAGIIKQVSLEVTAVISPH